MSSINLDALLAKISPEAPSGDDLSYDPAYLELIRSAAGTAEQQIGQTVVQAQEADWRQVRQGCLDLLQRTRDLNVALYLAAAELRLGGLPAFAQALVLIRGLIETFWDSVHPQLDPEDDNDPLARINLVAALAAPPGAQGDALQFQAKLRDAPLAESRQLGRFSLRDIFLATGEIPVAAGAAAPPTMDVISGALRDTDGEVLQERFGSAQEALAQLKAIEDGLTERLGAGTAPNLSATRNLLGQIVKHLQPFAAPQAAEADSDGQAGAEVTVASATGAPVQRLSGQITTAEDVRLALERICEYYAKYEPASPVPLLLRRAQKLISRSFLEIIQDMAPDSLEQIRRLGGIDNQ